MRALVWRYICLQHRQADSNPVTEDDVNEVKGEITAMRYELMNVLDKNGMDTSSADKKEKSKSSVVLMSRNKKRVFFPMSYE